jgi:hypothetical protein
MGRITILLGPPLICLAILLIGTAAYFFFEVVIPFLEFSTFTSIFLKIFGVYLVICLGFHYSMCIITDPGTPNKPADTIVMRINSV